MYDHKKIDAKWQKKWTETGIYAVSEIDMSHPKRYVLDMFPYPSGAGLHVGHPKGYVGTDVYARYSRAKGYAVLYPMGWDAFGLPAENYALKTKTHPSEATKANIKRYKEQLGKIGLSYDWNREINTTDPKYYTWTQWIFVKLFKKGLVYESNESINWCPSCKTGLANEDVDGNACERCGTMVEKKKLRQWVLKITKYADRLLSGLDNLEWPESIKELQRNWIGRSEGSEIDFTITSDDIEIGSIAVFTTRPDTLYGVTYCVIAPEHPLIEKNAEHITNIDAVRAYVREAGSKTEIERIAEDGEKTGICIEGVEATHPITGEHIPVYVADYVLGDYGTGAVMAVPAHDERDFAFAKKYDLPIKTVISSSDVVEGEVYTGTGIMIASGEFNGMNSEAAQKAITEKACGKTVVKYKLRDWVFSRQRYWGEPIPIIHCEKCGAVTVPEKDLPVELPNVESYEPSGTGESPLVNMEEWVNTTCPTCGGPAKRETNTMPQWAGSSWYYLRYIDPHNPDVLVDPEKEKYWMPVDLYVGGAEHATRHLIYARFWHMFLHDIGVVSTEEPFAHLQHVGLIGGEDGRKMSKRFGNVVNPDDIIVEYGADAFRVYEMFMGPFGDGMPWSTENISGTRRFLEKYRRIISEKPVCETDSEHVSKVLHSTIKKVGEDIEKIRFNTAVSALMILTNVLTRTDAVSVKTKKVLTQLVAPFAPHLAEEAWESLGEAGSVTHASWPEYDEALIRMDTITIAVQFNGKTRGSVEIDVDASEDEVMKAISEDEKLSKHIPEKINKIIYIPGKIINIV